VPQAGEALGDEPSHTRFAGRREQRVGPFGAKPDGLGEAAVEVPGEARILERGRLVHYRFGLGFQDGPAHGGRVEQIELERLGPECPYALGTAGRGERTDHFVSSIDQLGNESRPDRTAGSGKEDSHRALLSGCCHSDPISRF
jgi:hypothetical protein